MRIASVDQGTTSTRSVLLEDGRPPRVVHALRHAAYYPQPEWVEHDALELLANVRSCLREAGEVAAFGLANQGESCLAWDRLTGEPLSRVIVWQDNRTAARVERLRAEGAQQATLARAGLPLESYFSASKLAWLLRNVPAVAAAHAAGRLRLGTTDAFFIQHLTGRCATDVTTASRTSLMNLRTCQWDEELCRLFGVPIACLPPIQPSCSDFGEAHDTPLTASLVDQQAALYGHGCHARGQAKFTFGTGGFALVGTGTAPIAAQDAGLLPTVAWQIGGAPACYALDGGIYSAGAAIDWAARTGMLQSLAQLNGFDSPPAIARRLAFVPALTGLACPYWERGAGALWIGMSPSTSREDLLQSILEGVALRAAEVVDAIEAQIAIDGALCIDGGLAHSPYFCQFLCDVLQRHVRVPSFNELTALGAAQLAALGAGLAHGCAEPQHVDYEVQASAQAVRAWRARFAEAVKRSLAWGSEPL